MPVIPAIRGAGFFAGGKRACQPPVNLTVDEYETLRFIDREDKVVESLRALMQSKAKAESVAPISPTR